MMPTFNGTSGDDVLVGTFETILSTALTETISLKGLQGADRLDGGAGIDTASYVDSLDGAVTVDLSQGFGTGGDAQGDTLLNVENVTGSFFDDVLRGSGDSNVLRGLDDDDDLDGAGGDDTLEGGDGFDRLTGGTGADRMIGGDAGDVYFVDNPGDVVIEGASEGADEVRTLVSYKLAAGSEIESLDAGEAESTAAINLTGNEFSNVIIGSNGANVIDGGAGMDNMFGHAGADIYRVDNAGDSVGEHPASAGSDRVIASVSFALEAGQSIETLTTNNAAATAAINLTGNEFGNSIIGNAGNNVLEGKGGADTMAGFGGNDTYRIDNALDRVRAEAAGQGTDNVSATVSYTLAAGLSVETLRVQNPLTTNAVNLTANEIANIVTGNTGANVLSGLGGNDTILAGAGNDTLVGGLGKDSLTGSAGADKFDFNVVTESVRGANRDTIVDFVRAQGDKIDISTIDADTDGTAGNQAFTFIGAAAFAGVDGQLRCSAGIVQGDTNGDRVADFEIKVNVATLVTGDFVL